MYIQVTTVGDLLDYRAAVSQRDALIIAGARFTYRELSTATDRMAAGLVGLGVGPGDKVGLLMPNSADYVAALIGAAKLGAIAVPINARFKTTEAKHVISHADVKVLLLASDKLGVDYSALVRGIFPELAASKPGALDLPGAPHLKTIVDLSGPSPGCTSRAELEAICANIPISRVKTLQSRVRVRDTALLMYTSGTTAKPKGCLLTHEAVVRQAEKVARTRFMLGEDDALWDPLPLFHCGGIVPMLGCFAVGAKYCHPGHFEPGEALRTIQTERCTVLYPAFETIWQAVLDHPDFPSADLSHVRLIQNIATPERLAQFERKMPWARQVSSYGSTECSTNLTMSLPDDPYAVRMMTLGRPVDGMELKIVAPETGAPLPAGTMGELCFRGYSCFEGYYKDPEQTAATLDGERWFHTGDRAMLDENGNLIYGGRIKDMLKVGGENVAALEIEDYLARHPAVSIVQVVAAPDARYAEVPAAFIQLSAGGQLTEEDVIHFCVGAIASYKVPRYVRFVTEWPMSGTKIQKFVLRERIRQELKEKGLTEAPKVRTRGPERANVGGPDA